MAQIGENAAGCGSHRVASFSWHAGGRREEHHECLYLAVFLSWEKWMVILWSMLWRGMIWNRLVSLSWCIWDKESLDQNKREGSATTPISFFLPALPHLPFTLEWWQAILFLTAYIAADYGILCLSWCLCCLQPHLPPQCAHSQLWHSDTQHRDGRAHRRLRDIKKNQIENKGSWQQGFWFSRVLFGWKCEKCFCVSFFFPWMLFGTKDDIICIGTFSRSAPKTLPI